MSAPPGPVVFADCVLDTARRELRRDGAPVAVEPQVFDLIAHLAAHPGEIVSRDDLIEHVWGGRIVSDSAIASRINAARAALGDDGTAQRIIRTIPRRGFRFEAEPAPQAAAPAAPPLPDKPSIAVLPFQNMSGDPEQTYFSDGITDDIITDLSRYDELFVTARHSSFAYRASATPLAGIARELGVQYVAEGSVRRAGSRIRVTARLVDPWQGNELWADRYDRELTDIFAVQDEITGVIVNTLAGQIERQHYTRISAKSPETIDAYDHALKAAEHAFRVSPQDNALARQEACQAIAIDPGLARPHAILAMVCLNEGTNFWVDDPAESFRQAHQAAGAAVAADPRFPLGHTMLGIAELWANRAHDRAISEARRAMELNPSNAQLRALCTYVLAFAGQPEAALAELDIAMRNDPLYPALYLGYRGRALLLLHRFDEALPVIERMALLMPEHSNALGFAAICYAALGRTDEAREMADRLARLSPRYRLGTLRRFLPYSRPRDLAFTLEMLERAGLPE